MGHHARRGDSANFDLPQLRGVEVGVATARPPVTLRLFPTRVLAEAAVLIALSAALHLIRPFTLPQGGSVTAGAMVPVLLFALRRGVKPGVIAGAIFGLIVLYEEPFIFHPVQVVLDYPLAFGALGLAGLLRTHPIPGVALGIFGRFVAHFLSGVLFFASFAPEGTHPALYSAIYNGGYLGVEFVISGAVMFLLLRTRVLQIRL